MNKISIIGAGRLGLCLSLNLSEVGYDVVAIDINDSYIQSLKDKTFDSPEPYVNELLKNTKVKFTTDIRESKDSEIIFICVLTPSMKNGSFNHYQIENVIKSLNEFTNKKHIVINSTTMPGFCEEIQSKYSEFYISYSPEFIAQGSIIKDQKNPDIVLIGEYDKVAGDFIEDVYKRICVNDFKVHRMKTTEAEITKLGLNCFITSKIAMTNSIGDLCVVNKVNPQVVLNAIGDDKRVGNKCTMYGFGFGGPCFPRDNRAFKFAANKFSSHDIMNDAIDKSNKEHLIFQVNQTLSEGKDDFVIEPTYKPNTDIIDESQQLLYAYELVRNGKNVKLKCDKRTKEKIEEKYPNIFQYEV